MFFLPFAIAAGIFCWICVSGNIIFIVFIGVPVFVGIWAIGNAILIEIYGDGSGGYDPMAGKKKIYDKRGNVKGYIDK